jgi:serine/threonine protein kinase
MFDLGEIEGAHFITMEYVQGEDLRSSIRRFGQLPIGKSISIAKQICDGLSEAHRLGTVHRDLKSNNIMIDKEGNARIMDFGIARSIEAKSITGAGVMIGTPEYMSPEQVEGKEVDHRSDIYSLGIILYEMLTGQLPFGGDTPLSIAVKQKTETPTDPKQINPQIPDALSDVILHCLEKEKDKRFHKAEEVLQELTDIEKGIPTTERIFSQKEPLTSREITVKFRVKRHLIPAFIIIGLAILASFLILTRTSDLDPNRIVVMDFENQTGDVSLDHIGKMAADWISQGLSQTGIVSVANSPPSAGEESIKQGKGLVQRVGRQTGAGKVLSGTYYLQVDTLRFQTQLSNAQRGNIIHSFDPVSGSLEEPVEIIEILRQRIMGQLAVQIDERMSTFVEAGLKPPKYEAYKEYFEAARYFYRFDYDNVFKHCEKAIAIDPEFASPLIMMMIGYANDGNYAKVDSTIVELNKLQDNLSLGDQNMVDFYKYRNQGDLLKAYPYVRQAAQFDPHYNYHLGLHAMRINRLEEAVDALKTLDPAEGWLKDWVGYWGQLTWANHMLENHRQELKEARRGRQQYPDSHSTLWYETRALIALGKLDEVNKRVEENFTFPPQGTWNPSIFMILAGEIMRFHGFIEESKSMFERAIQWLNNQPQEDSKTRTHRYRLLRALYGVELWDEAQDVCADLHVEYPESIYFLGRLGTIAARQGNNEEAVRISEQLAQLDRPYLFGNHTLWQASIAAVLGEKEKAITLIKEALSQGQYYGSLHADLDFESLKDYPPFVELIKPIG